MSVLQLTFGCGPSDKVAAIFDRRVRIEGCELSCFPMGPEEAFHRAFVMGPDIWPYGVPGSRRELDAMVRWSVEQGLSARQVSIEELFAPGTLQGFQGKD
jgi:hypothetical protein